MAAKGVIAGRVASWVKAPPSRAYGHAGRPGLVRPSIRFMSVAAHTEARKRRVNLVRQFPRRRDVAGAPSPVPRGSSARDNGRPATPPPLPPPPPAAPPPPPG